MKQQDDETVFKTKGAAKYLGVSEDSLRQGRMNGPRKNRMPAPPFHKFGRSITYRKTDLDQWLKKHRIDLDKNGDES